MTDVDSLVKEVETLLTDEDYRRYYGRHAVEVLYQNQERCSACCSCWNRTCRPGVTE